MDNNLDKYLSTLRDQLTRAQKAESLYRCMNCGHLHEGYDFLKSEITKILEALKGDAISVKSLTDPTMHATTVGAHNALRSLLEIIEGLYQKAPGLSAEIQQVEKDNKEELDRLNARKA